MEEVLTIHIPGEIRHMLNRTSEELARDVRLYAALMLFRMGKLSSGAAAKMAGVPRVTLLDLCAEYDIPVSQTTGDDLHKEFSYHRRNMTTELTIHLPEPLLQQARQAASAARTSLEEFVSQAISAQVQQQQPQTVTGTADWPKERMTRDRIWIDTHYQTLAENYPNQWVYVHQQKVCGAHRDMAKAEEQAEQILGDVQQAFPLAIFVATRYVI